MRLLEHLKDTLRTYKKDPTLIGEGCCSRLYHMPSTAYLIKVMKLSGNSLIHDSFVHTAIHQQQIQSAIAELKELAVVVPQLLFITTDDPRKSNTRSLNFDAKQFYMGIEYIPSLSSFLPSDSQSACHIARKLYDIAPEKYYTLLDDLLTIQSKGLKLDIHFRAKSKIQPDNIQWSDELQEFVFLDVYSVYQGEGLQYSPDVLIYIVRDYFACRLGAKNRSAESKVAVRLQEIFTDWLRYHQLQSDACLKNEAIY